MDETILSGKTLLVVDDEVDLREIVASELEFMGARVFQAENVTTAQNILNKNQIDLIVSDIRMPGGTGIDLLKYVKSRNVQVPPVILITGFADITVEDAFDKGAEALISKPFKLEDLIKNTVKLTEPAEKRFTGEESFNRQLDIQFSEMLETKINSKECSIGRGGLAITVDSNGSKCELGEVLKFDLKFKDTELKGTAVCRWWKPADEANKATVGLEFVQLSEPTLKYFLNYWKKHFLVPFIPSLD